MRRHRESSEEGSYSLDRSIISSCVLTKASAHHRAQRHQNSKFKTYQVDKPIQSRQDSTGQHGTEAQHTTAKQRLRRTRSARSPRQALTAHTFSSYQRTKNEQKEEQGGLTRPQRVTSVTSVTPKLTPLTGRGCCGWPFPLLDHCCCTRPMVAVSPSPSSCGAPISSAKTSVFLSRWQTKTSRTSSSKTIRLGTYRRDGFGWPKTDH